MNLTRTLYPIEVLGPNGRYTSLRPSLVTDVAGAPVAELSLAPVPYVARAMAALRKADDRDIDRPAMIAEAGRRFRDERVAGLGPDEYKHLVSRVTGLPIAEIAAATDQVAAGALDVARRARFGIPSDAILRRKDAPHSVPAPLWARRGRVFAMHASGNHPGVNGSWLQALALGFRVAVRPSRREPLTAHRLVAALWESGFHQDEVVFMPTDYAAADEILRGADLAMVYGGDDVVAKYNGLKVRPNGPGRSKILITAGADWHDHVDLVVDSAAKGGGAGCVNVTAVFVEGDATGLAEAVAEKLKSMPSLPPEDPAAVLPVHPIEQVRKTAAYVNGAAEGAHVVLGGTDLVGDLGDGSAAQRPSVHVLPSAGDARARIELPFPCVWFAAWSPSDGLEPLKDTLKLTVLGAGDDLIDDLAAEASIDTVFVGPRPTYWAPPGLPHTGYLSHFLLEPRGYFEGGAA